MHCHCHLLQLACVQAVNDTEGSKHVHRTDNPVESFFYYSPKRSENLIEVWKVLIKFSKLKIVKAVNANYAAFVVAFEKIYKQSHEPEALRISKALLKASTLSATFLLTLYFVLSTS